MAEKKQKTVEDITTTETVVGEEKKKNEHSLFVPFAILLIVLLILVAVGISAYYYTGDANTGNKTNSTEVAKSADEKELDSIGTEMNIADKEFDTASTDADASEIEKLDLTGV